ncbi:MAG: hypothetical protein ABFR53_05980 [Actinomycetota bacterium]
MTARTFIVTGIPASGKSSVLGPVRLGPIGLGRLVTVDTTTPVDIDVIRRQL